MVFTVGLPSDIDFNYSAALSLENHKVDPVDLGVVHIQGASFAVGYLMTNGRNTLVLGGNIPGGGTSPPDSGGNPLAK